MRFSPRRPVVIFFEVAKSACQTDLGNINVSITYSHVSDIGGEVWR